MSYQCYVFDNEQQLIKDIEYYKQRGGYVSDLKILIKDVEHGNVLSASGYHHVDYLSEITAANRQLAEKDYNEATYIAGIINSQQTPAVVTGLHPQEEHYALEALKEYGLDNSRAVVALQALRTGHYLLFAQLDSTGYETGSHQLSSVLSASFGHVRHSDDTSEEASSYRMFEHAQYML